VKLNAAFGGNDQTEKNIEAHKHWRSAITELWKSKGIISPDDPSFLSLAVRSPEKVEAFFSELQKANERYAKWVYGNALQKNGFQSLASYVDQPVDESGYLLGDGLLSKGGGMFISAGSGIGKSVIATQCAISWSVGLPAFGIHPKRPLKILIIQAEDNDNKVIRMTRMAKKIVPEVKWHLFEQNVQIKRIQGDLVGESLLKLAESIHKGFSFDILILNPLFSYMEGDLTDGDDCSHFLRHVVDPFIARMKCGIIIVHHTPKQRSANEDPNKKWSEDMYAMYGPAELTNWARSIMHVESTNDDGVFKFKIAKGLEESGWNERHKYFSHSKEKATTHVGRVRYFRCRDSQSAARPQ